MNALTDWFQQPFVTRLGWTLIHFLWQGSVIALALALAQPFLQRRSTRARYAVACLALALMAIAPPLTLLALPGRSSSVGNSAFAALEFPATLVNTALGAAANPDPFSTSTWTGRLDSLLPWLVLLWSAGVGILTARLAGGWLQIQQLRKRAVEPIGEPWLNRLRDLQQRLRITRPVQLLKSALVEVPAVIGWFRPVILLPASTLTGLTPDQLEAVLAHELAHIRRNDYLVNLLQRVIETLLFYHPAVWWVSHRIRVEREHCCDDVAVQVCEDRFGYARALATLEGLRLAPTDLALAASDGSITERIRRLLGMGADQKRTWRRPVLLALAGLALIGVTAWPDLIFRQKLYASTVRISISKDSDSTTADGAAKDGTTVFDPYWIQTEFEKIVSKSVLCSVIDRLKLGERFAARSGSGSRMDQRFSYELLRKRIAVRPQPNTSLVSITVTSEDPQEAAEIANQIAATYQEQRVVRKHTVSTHSFELLRDELERQRQQVDHARQQMEKARAELGDVDLLNGEPVQTPDVETVRIFERAKAEVEVKLVYFESLRKSLDDTAPEELVNAISLSYPDSRLGELLSQRDLAEGQRAQLLNEFSQENPKVVATAHAVKRLGEQIDTRVRSLLEQIQLEVKRNRAQLKFLDDKIRETRKVNADKASRHRPYLEAKRDYEAQLRVFDTLELRHRQETIDSRLTQSWTVEIVDPAEPALRPVRRWF